MKKMNVLQMVKEQKKKKERQHMAQLCAVGYCKPEAKR